MALSKSEPFFLCEIGEKSKKTKLRSEISWFDIRCENYFLFILKNLYIWHCMKDNHKIVMV